MNEFPGSQIWEKYLPKEYGSVYFYYSDQYRSYIQKDCKELFCKNWFVNKDARYNQGLFYSLSDPTIVADSFNKYATLIGLSSIADVSILNTYGGPIRVVSICNIENILECEAAAILIRVIEKYGLFKKSGEIKIEDLFIDKKYFYLESLQKVFSDWIGFLNKSGGKLDDCIYNFDNSSGHGGLIDWLNWGVLSI